MLAGYQGWWGGIGDGGGFGWIGGERGGGDWGDRGREADAVERRVGADAGDYLQFKLLIDLMRDHLVLIEKSCGGESVHLHLSSIPFVSIDESVTSPISAHGHL